MLPSAACRPPRLPPCSPRAWSRPPPLWPPRQPPRWTPRGTRRWTPRRTPRCAPRGTRRRTPRGTLRGAPRCAPRSPPRTRPRPRASARNPRSSGTARSSAPSRTPPRGRWSRIPPWSSPSSSRPAWPRGGTTDATWCTCSTPDVIASRPSRSTRASSWLIRRTSPTRGMRSSPGRGSSPPRACAFPASRLCRANGSSRSRRSSASTACGGGGSPTSPDSKPGITSIGSTTRATSTARRSRSPGERSTPAGVWNCDAS